MSSPAYQDLLATGDFMQSGTSQLIVYSMCLLAVVWAAIQTTLIHRMNMDPHRVKIAQQLQSINVPAGFNGTVVLEIPIQNGRLTRFVLDDVVSTVTDKNLVEMIKRSLQNVILPSTAKGSIRLTLSVKL